MIGNISILICSFFFICVIYFYLLKVWPDIDVLDLYIVFILFHFGFYPFIRGLYFGKDNIWLDLGDSNPLIIGVVFGHVLLILAVIKISYMHLFKNVREFLKIERLIQEFSCVNKLVLLLIYGILILFPIFSYYKYGIKTYIMPDDFKQIGKQLPYWFTSIRTVYPLFAFVVSLGLIASLLKSRGYYKYIWIIITVLFVPIVSIYGRRFFLGIIIVWAIFWCSEDRKEIFSMKYLKVGLGLICAFFLFSNLFQAYRPIFESVGHIKLQNMENPFNAALNFKATINNVQLRAGTWEFNFVVFDHQFTKPGMTTNGKIAWEGIKSAIPKLLWPGKQFMWTDDILVALYHKDKRQIDIGKNLFGVGQLEIGYLSLIVVPLIIIMIIVMMGSLVKMTLQYPTFLWLFSGNILYFLLNIEENGNEIFFMLRNTCLIFIIFCGYLIINKIIMFHLLKFRKVSESIGK